MKGFMSVNGIIGTWAGPDAPGTAYVLMHHSVGDIGDGEVASWGFMEGGMGAVAEACEASAKSFGAEVRLNAPVGKITTRGGRATGVVLEDGTELRAPLVVTAIHPKITFLQQLDPSELPADFVRDIEHWSSRSGVVKINCALDRLPVFTSNPELTDQSGGVELAHPSRTWRRRSRRRAGRLPTLPFSDGVVPTSLDLTRAGGQARIRCSQWVPHTERGAAPRSWMPTPVARSRATTSWRRVRGQRAASPAIGPYDMGTSGADGGNIFHGVSAGSSSTCGRRGTRTTARRSGLYQCSTTHAGGGVTGIGVQLRPGDRRDRKRSSRSRPKGSTR
jgi:phytoene dehydrogenase-like protein